MDIDHLPGIIWDLYKDLLDRTSIEPSIARSGFGKITLTHGSDRVQVRVVFKNAQRKWTWADSSLHIDGKKAKKLAVGIGEYCAILKDPDNGRHAYTPEGCRRAKLPDKRIVEEEQHLPSFVAAAAKELRSGATAEGTVVTVYVSTEANLYLIGIENPKKSSAFFTYTPSAMEWVLSSVTIINLLGYDVTNHHSDFIEELLVELLGAESRKNQKSYLPESRSHGQAGMANSVAVRKNTVFRV